MTETRTLSPQPKADKVMSLSGSSAPMKVVSRDGWMRAWPVAPPATVNSFGIPKNSDMGSVSISPGTSWRGVKMVRKRMPPLATRVTSRGLDASSPKSAYTAAPPNSRAFFRASSTLPRTLRRFSSASISSI
ncbi:hypothetical protein D3C87_1373950 [compost metagenome]